MTCFPVSRKKNRSGIELIKITGVMIAGVRIDNITGVRAN